MAVSRKRRTKTFQERVADDLVDLHREDVELMSRVARLEEKWMRPIIPIPYGFRRFVMHTAWTLAVAAAVVELARRGWM